MKVAFRVDASLQAGSGHVMRCLTLADALTAGGAQCHFISREHVGNLLALIQQRGYKVERLPASAESNQSALCEEGENDRDDRIFHEGWLGTPWQKDAEQTYTAIKNLQLDWLVVDHYAIDQRWEAVLLPHIRKLMVIDDLADRVHQCHILLDQNLGRKSRDYAALVPAQCKLLTGPKYALLQPKFAELREYSQNRRKSPELKQLLISMGGVDQQNATGQVLQALQECELTQVCRITVVMGLQAPSLELVRAQAQRMRWPTEVLVGVSNMAQLMADSDLAVGASGSTAWERCCLGLPSLLVVLANNQWFGAKALAEVQAAYLIGDTRKIMTDMASVFKLANQIEHLTQMSECASRVTDGFGVEKVFRALEDLSD